MKGGMTGAAAMAAATMGAKRLKQGMVEKCGLKVCYGVEHEPVEKFCNLDKGHAGPCSLEKKHIS